jgi:ribose 5-phosphate isomerase B
MERIIIGSDHGGFALKQELKAYLARKGLAVTDAGTYSGESCDYTDTASEVARLVSAGKYRRAILICKSGIGNSIVANKFPGVRAALCYQLACARSSREHNDSNILVLGAAFTAPGLAKRLVAAWLTTPFAGGRHGRRVNKIRQVERSIAKTMNRRGLR